MHYRRFAGLLRFLRLQPQRAIGLLALVVGVLLCLLVANDLQRDYEGQFSAAAAKTNSLTQLLEEHARQSMRRVELSMAIAAQEVRAQTPAGKQISAATGPRLRALLPQDGLIASFAVLDSKGVVVASTQTEDAASLPRADGLDFYLMQQDPAQSGLYVGSAVKSRTSGLWIIPMSIKLGAGLDGYLLGIVDPEYFQHLYQSIDTGNNGSVTLFTLQGWAIARWPFHSEFVQRNWLDSPLFKTHIPAALVGSIREVDTADDTPRVYSYRVLQEYPLVVSLAVSMDDALKPWRQRALLACGGLFLTLLFLGAATVLLIWQLRRRSQAESALKLSEISLLKSSLPTLWIGRDGRILRVNRAACELHGYSEEQMLGMTVPDLNPEMSWSSWPGHWERLRKSGRMHFETVHRCSQGRDIPVEADLNFIEFEGREYNFAFIRDLTLRKQAEVEIQRGAATLRDAIDAVDEAFVLFDKDDRMVYCNAKYQELYPGMRDMMKPGVSFEDLVRVGATQGLYQESIGRQEEWIAGRLRAHREGNDARIQKRDDGRVMRVIDRKTPQGHIVGIRVDITEMVRATEEAQEASRYKSQFLANMSHEIRTPMNAILGLLTLLQKTELSPAQRDYASKTEGAARSLLGLLNDILDFSKVEAGKMELDPQAFRLERLLSNVSVILCSTIGGKNLEVLFDIEASVPTVVIGDSMRLQQVLVNLGGNAIKFTERGKVVLQVRNVPAPEHALADANWIEFAIQDSGIGIAADKQAHIFSGFSQAEASTTRRYGGSGLGLAICKGLVELMGGSLTLQSIPGEGSLFRFSLPLPAAPAQSDEPEGATDLAHNAQRVWMVDDKHEEQSIPSTVSRGWPGPTVAGAQQVVRPQRKRSGSDRPLAGMRILVVEDNLINQQVALELLGAEGAVVSLAANGQLGVDAVAASQQPFDVVLMDLQMPVLDGYGATRKIREQLGFTQLPIVAVTANAMDSDRLACLAAGMNGHVGKPFEMGELVALLLVLSGREAPVVDGPSEVLPNLQGAFVAVPYAENPAPLRGLLESPYLDVAAALDRLSGLTELYLDIAPEFVKSLDTVEEEFRQAAAQSQWPALTVQMHSLKGVSATLGAVALSQHAARLERLFHTPSADLVALDHLPDLLKLVAATRAAMQSALQVLATEAVQEPEPERLPAGPAGRARARAFIAELMDLLATQNLAVLECFARRSDALDALSKVCVDDLQAALQSLNLVRARQLCETHMHSLAVD